MSQNEEKLLKEYLWVKTSQWEDEIRLLQKAQKYTTVFRYIPGILCLCVCNSVAMNAAHKDSDIDLFVITKNKRLWTVRILLTFLVALLWQRKTSREHTGKFCLSFFITENSLNLEEIALKNDYYLSYWTENLIPLINREHSLERFQRINTSSPNSLSSRIGGSKRSEWGWGHIWDIWEYILKKIFLPRTKKSFQKLWKPFWVIISDDMLKFHDQDRRKEIREYISQWSA